MYKSPVLSQLGILRWESIKFLGFLIEGVKLENSLNKTILLFTQKHTQKNLLTLRWKLLNKMQIISA